MTDPARRFWAHVALLTAGMGWALTPVGVRLMNGDIDPFTLSFYRYAIALGPLLGMSLAFYRADLWRALKDPLLVLPVAAVMALQQYTWIEGLVGVPAATAHLIMKLSVVFIIVLSYIVFHEERGVIRSPRFLLGTVTSFAGVALVLNPGNGGFLPSIDFYSLLVLITAGLWALYSVGGKHLAKGLHPVPMFTVLALYITAAFAGLTVAYGEPGLVFRLRPGAVALIGVISILPLAIGHPLFHVAQKNLGSSYCGTFNLFTPAVTYALAMILLPDEQLTPVQLLGACCLLAGTFAVSRVQPHELPAVPADAELAETRV